MKQVYEMVAAVFEIEDIKAEINGLYIRKKELENELHRKIERLKELTRKGKTLEQLEEIERSFSDNG